MWFTKNAESNGPNLQAVIEAVSKRRRRWLVPFQLLTSSCWSSCTQIRSWRLTSYCYPCMHMCLNITRHYLSHSHFYLHTVQYVYKNELYRIHNTVSCKILHQHTFRCRCLYRHYITYMLVFELWLMQHISLYFSQCHVTLTTLLIMSSGALCAY